MNGYYVDEWTGLVCSTSKAPSGCHFEFKVKEGYHEVWIVADKDGEVLQEAVFWESLEALVAVTHRATGIMDATIEMIERMAKLEAAEQGKRKISEECDRLGVKIEVMKGHPPYASIDKILTEVMDIAAANGADSRSMPDEYVEVAEGIKAAMLAAAPEKK